MVCMRGDVLLVRWSGGRYVKGSLDRFYLTHLPNNFNIKKVEYDINHYINDSIFHHQ